MSPESRPNQPRSEPPQPSEGKYAMVAARRAKVALLREGDKKMPILKIAEILGLSPKTVSNDLSALSRQGRDVVESRGPYLSKAKREARKQALARQYRGGKKLKEMSEATGIKKEHVGTEITRMRRHGGYGELPYRDKKGKTKEVSTPRQGRGRNASREEREREKSTITRLYLQGLSYDQIGEAIQRSTAIVGSQIARMRAAGVDLPRRKGNVGPEKDTQALAASRRELTVYTSSKTVFERNDKKSKGEK